MKILINAFHPDIESSTVNAAWIKAAEEAGFATVNALYSRYPDWNIDVEREQALLMQHERIVFQHPLMWYSVPPLMKKWLDEVLTHGWAYGGTQQALAGKEWMTAVSTGEAQTAYSTDGGHNSSMQSLLSPMQKTTEYIGMTYLEPFILHGTAQASADDIRHSAQRYLRHIAQ